MESTKRMVRSGFVALIAIVCAFALAFGLSACGGGKSEEDAVKAAVAEELDQFSSASSDAAAAAFEASGGEAIEKMGINGKDFIGAWLDGYAYEIGDISIDGDKADVNVTITAKNLVDAVSNIKEEAVTYFQENGVSTEDEAYKVIGSLMMDDLNNAEPKTSDVVITMQKDSKGNWSLTSDGQAVLMDLLLGDASSLDLE